MSDLYLSNALLDMTTNPEPVTETEGAQLILGSKVPTPERETTWDEPEEGSLAWGPLAFGRTWCLRKHIGIEQVFPRMFSITGHLWLQGFLELKKFGLRLPFYIALKFSSTWLSCCFPNTKPLIFDFIFFSLQWAVAGARAQPRAQLCEGPAPFVSFEPATC